ncbi:MAG: sensor histidine kinase [Bacteroidetes bacterium]|nr:sensor histidine kinase [Bacteroidota bacterium]
MKSTLHTSIRTLLCLIALISVRPTAFAQEPVGNWEEELGHVKDLLAGSRNDSALVLLRELEKEIDLANLKSSHIGMWVQLYIGDALEKDFKDELAITQLLWVKEESDKLGYPAIHAEACIILGLLFEKRDLPRQSRQNLQQAEKYIREYELDSIYPEYAIRLSSYHRIHGDRDSARYYADRALESSVRLNLTEQIGVSHLLLGLLDWKKCDEALYHFREAGKYYYELGDYTGYAYMWLNGIRTNQHCNRLEEALIYSDSSLKAIKLAQEAGNDFFLWSGAYKRRANVFYAMGKMDSAWYNINLASDLGIEEQRQLNSEKVKEIDAKYNNDKKARRLKEQEQEITFERQRRFWLTISIVLTLIILSVVILSYLRLRKSNKVVMKQSRVIRENNAELTQALKEQVLLRNEVHHRVKNNLQVIISLLEIQEEELVGSSAKSELRAMANRVYSMATVHEILYQGDNVSKIDFAEYTRRICSHLASLSPFGESPEFENQIDQVFFNIETSIPLGIMLTELLTNSLKYARVSGQSLKILIQLKSIENGFLLNYRDNGPGMPDGWIDKDESGLGTYLIRSMVRQLRGKFESFNDNGAVFEIFFEEKNSV